MNGKPLFYRSVIPLACLLLLMACSAFPATEMPTAPTQPANETPVPSATQTPIPTTTPTSRPSATPTRTPIPTRTNTLTATQTPLTSNTPTDTPAPLISQSPTAVVLLSRVNTRAQCRYGPGKAYLYKLGLEVGEEMIVIGRNEKGTWAQVTPPDRKYPCWVSAELINIQGDLMSVPFAYVWLPISPYYGPLRDVRAEGHGGTVTISWEPLKLRKGDEGGEYRYLVEAWVCEGRQAVLVALGTNEPFIEFEAGSGCSGGSHARVYGVEKHGYTPPVNVSW